MNKNLTPDQLKVLNSVKQQLFDTGLSLRDIEDHRKDLESSAFMFDVEKLVGNHSQPFENVKPFLIMNDEGSKGIPCTGEELQIYNGIKIYGLMFWDRHGNKFSNR